MNQDNHQHVVSIPNPLRRKGIIFVLSGPSGSGKSTVCQSLRRSSDFSFIVSHTTREPRSGEVDGVDYRFITVPDFEEKVSRGFFLEHAVVHGRHYGTPKGDVLHEITSGRDVLLDIDVEGARQVRELLDVEISQALVDIFILPPNMAELERRLQRRGTESFHQIEVRMESARREIPSWREYRYTLVSESMEEDLTKIRSIIRAERYRTCRLADAEKTGDL